MQGTMPQQSTVRRAQASGLILALELDLLAARRGHPGHLQTQEGALARRL